MLPYLLTSAIARDQNDPQQFLYHDNTMPGILFSSYSSSTRRTMKRSNRHIGIASIQSLPTTSSGITTTNSLFQSLCNGRSTAPKPTTFERYNPSIQNPCSIKRIRDEWGQFIDIDTTDSEEEYCLHTAILLGESPSN